MLKSWIKVFAILVAVVAVCESAPMEWNDDSDEVIIKENTAENSEITLLTGFCMSLNAFLNRISRAVEQLEEGRLGGGIQRAIPRRHYHLTTAAGRVRGQIWKDRAKKHHIPVAKRCRPVRSHRGTFQ